MPVESPSSAKTPGTRSIRFGNFEKYGYDGILCKNIFFGKYFFVPFMFFCDEILLAAAMREKIAGLGSVLWRKKSFLPKTF